MDNQLGLDGQLIIYACMAFILATLFISTYQKLKSKPQQKTTSKKGGERVWVK